MKRILLLIIIIILSTYISFSQNIWKKLSGPHGGFGNGLYSKGDTLIYNSSIPTIIFYSFDRGNSWKQANLRIKERITDYIETLDGHVLAAAENKIYKTKNFSDWTVLGVPASFQFFGKDYLGNLYAGARNSKVYSSSDSGVSWSFFYDTKPDLFQVEIKFVNKKDSTLVFSGFNKLVLKKPNQPNLDTIASPNMNSPRIVLDDNYNYYVQSGTYFRNSTDSGFTWRGGDVQFLWGESMSDFIFNNRIIGAFEDQTSSFGHGWGVAVSDDSGKTWRWSNVGLPPYSVGDKLAKSGTDTYLGTWGSGVFKSTDFGDSWFPINNGINAAEVMDILFTKDSSVYSAAWASGLSKSTDFGKSWEMINYGVNNTYFYCIISDSAGNLYAGSEKGLFKSTDEGENWSITSFTGFAYKLFKDNKNQIYILNYDAGLYKSTDQGNTFTKINNGFVSDGVWSFASDSSGNIYAGIRDGYIYKSTDYGTTWSILRASVTGSFGINNISIAPNGCIFAGSWDEGVLRSTDNGLTWQQLKTGSSWKYVSGLGVNKEGLIFVSLKESTYLDALEILLISSDNGETFKNCTGNLQLVYVKNIKFDNRNQIWVGSRDGIYVADIAGITDIKSDNSVMAKEYHLYQNYPNPFNPATEIKYSIPAAGYVLLKVYDILGKEISSLVNEEKPVGEYTVTFNGSRYPSGVYFYTIRSGNFTETKKLMILK